jgi:hypothetical protein
VENGDKENGNEENTGLLMHMCTYLFCNNLSNSAISPYACTGQWFTHSYSYSLFMSVIAAFHFSVKDGLPSDEEEEENNMCLY